MRKRRKITEKPALDLIEDTVELLRRCPLGAAVMYYAGTVPFVLGFLYFWTDMSRGAYARDHLVESSLIVAIGFLWCKCWQSLFAVHLLAAAAHRTLPRWTWRRVLRLAVGQASLQPTGLFVLPVAALITLPIGYAVAFYHNAAALALDGEGEPLEGAALRREALAQARRWPGQNYAGLSLLNLFGLAVFVNLLITIIALPWLLKRLFGIETMFTRSLWSVLNTTLFGSAAALTYLCVDPIIKAFYILRCFHGRSLATGEDLRVALRVAAGPLVRVAAMALVLACAGIARGDEPAVSPGAPPRSTEINQSITDVLNRPQFAWRSPREEASPQQRGPFGNFLEGIINMLRGWGKPIGRWLGKFARWLGEKLVHQPTKEEPTGGGVDWGAVLRLFAWIFCGLAVVALVIIGWKVWKRSVAPVYVVAEAQPAMPDLTAEDIAADQLPEDAWLGLARQMMERGEFRLALRALYLAALAHLGDRQFISIARHKSNRDYQRELRRRRPGETELNATFADAVRAFERAWYGQHEVTPDILSASEVNLQRIRQC